LGFFTETNTVPSRQQQMAESQAIRTAAGNRICSFALFWCLALEMEEKHFHQGAGTFFCDFWQVVARRNSSALQLKVYFILGCSRTE
jgi:hypothetical protein